MTNVCKRIHHPGGDNVSEQMTPKQISDELRIDRQTVYKMIHDGRLPAVRVGKRGLRIPREAVAALLKPVK